MNYINYAEKILFFKNVISKWIYYCELNHTKHLPWCFNKWQDFSKNIINRPKLISITDYDIYITNKIFYRIKKIQSKS